MVVQHNLTAMNSNRMLGLTTASQAKSTERLSSGYKINRAADDAAGLSISEKMRKQIRGLTQASANAEDGISAVQTAEGALTEVHDMLQRMNELAVKAANETNSVDDREYIQNEIDQLVTEIDRVAETTKFNETYLLKGNGQVSKEYTASYATDVLDGSATIKDGTTLYQADGTAFDADSLALALDTDPDTKVYTTAPTAGTLATAASVTGSADNYKAAADLYDADGTKVYSSGADVSNADYAKLTTDFYTAAPTAGTEATEGTDYTYTPGGTPQLYDVNGNKVSANGLDAYLDIAEDGTATMKANKTLYTDEKGQSALAAADISDYITTAQSKTASLDIALHVGADATDNNQITMEIEAMDATTLGLRTSDGILQVSGSDDTNARDAIETIKAAIQKVSTQRSALGAVQNRLEHTINNLDNVVENTTAAESQIRDTDMASEMVKYSNNNILAQAGQAMLAQANQSNQGVLSLLG